MIIPGQSLTAEPKNAPYENPPTYTTAEDAVFWHLDRLSSEDKLEALVDAMELGLDVVTLTEGLLRGAVLEGRHTVDISLIIAPVIHEFIKITAENVGIDFDEGIPDDTEERYSIEYAINSRKAKKLLEEYEEETGKDVTFEEPVPKEDTADNEQMDEPKEEKEENNSSQGLMSRMSKLEGEV
tara:strand:- start:597 stop:1145 length:549 start_codon:yes stop_codon:yes gene_type:complete